MLRNFKKEDPEITNVEIVDRSKSDELAGWTQTVLTYLPGIDDSPEGVEGTNQISNHFKTIKVLCLLD